MNFLQGQLCKFVDDLIWGFDVEMIDPSKCSDACLHGVVQQLAGENLHHRRDVQLDGTVCVPGNKTVQ